MRFAATTSSEFLVTTPSGFLVTTPSGFLATTPGEFLARRIRAFTVVYRSHTRYATNALKFARKKPGNAWLKIQVVPPPGFEPGTY